MSSTNDINYKSYVNEQGLEIAEFTGPADPLNYSDILKFSNCVNVSVSGIVIPGGREDAIDAVRGSNYTFEKCFVNGSITIKGAIDTVYIKSCMINSKKKYSIELGQFDNYWTAGRGPTKNITIENTESLDGSEVVVYLWDTEEPHIINSNVKIVKIPKIVWLPYFLFRRAYLKATGKIK